MLVSKHRNSLSAIDHDQDKHTRSAKEHWKTVSESRHSNRST